MTARVTSGSAWENLEQQLRTGKPAPKVKPVMLARKSVKLWPEVFQQRRPAPYVSAAHVRGLGSKAQASPDNLLDAVTVWWDGKNWACIDGHHRMAAYQQEQLELVAVEVFNGTLEEALLYSARANTRDKLTMSTTEKANAAWRLVVRASSSKAVIADATGISQSTVALMRKAKATLKGQGESALMDMHWETARRLARGEEPEDGGWPEGETERRAALMAKALGKALGTSSFHRVEVFSMALELYSPQLLKGLLEFNRIHEDDLEQGE